MNISLPLLSTEKKIAGIKPATTELSWSSIGNELSYLKWIKGALKGETGATEIKSTPTAASCKLSWVIYEW